MENKVLLLKDYREMFESALTFYKHNLSLGAYRMAFLDDFISHVDTSIDICKSLDTAMRNTGFRVVASELDKLIDTIGRELSYDPHYSPSREEINSVPRDKYIEKAVYGGLITKVEDDEVYAVEGVGEFGESVIMDESEFFNEYLKDDYIDDIIDQCIANYKAINTTASVFTDELIEKKNQLTRIIYDYDYRDSFIKSLSLIVEPPNTTPSTNSFEDYFVYKDMEKFKSVLRDMLKGKQSKDIAVVLLSLERLNIVNLQTNRARLYRTLRGEGYIGGTDAGINTCLTTNKKREAEVAKEVELLKKRLEA